MSTSIALPDDLVAAIDAYLDADWTDGRNPSKLGALNAVAYIGECVASLRKEERVPRCRHGVTDNGSCHRCHAETAARARSKRWRGARKDKP